MKIVIFHGKHREERDATMEELRNLAALGHEGAMAALGMVLEGVIPEPIEEEAPPIRRRRRRATQEV